MPVVKVIELVGISNQGWEQAAQSAIENASETLQNIESVEVTNLSATVQDGKIEEYQADVRISFRIENRLRHEHHEHHGHGEKAHM